MIQTFDRNTATLIMGMSAPILIQIAQWKDLVEFLKEQQVIKLEIVQNPVNLSPSVSANQVQLRYLVINEFSVVFVEEAQYNINRVHKFERDGTFSWNYTDALKAELKYFGYKDQDILPQVNAENLFDDD